MRARRKPGLVPTVPVVTATPHPDDAALLAANRAAMRARALRELFGLLLVLAGAGAVIWGSWMLTPAAAVITGGVIAIAVGWAMTTGRVDE